MIAIVIYFDSLLIAFILSCLKILVPLDERRKKTWISFGTIRRFLFNINFILQTKHHKRNFGQFHYLKMLPTNATILWICLSCVRSYRQEAKKHKLISWHVVTLGKND